MYQSSSRNISKASRDRNQRNNSWVNQSSGNSKNYNFQAQPNRAPGRPTRMPTPVHATSSQIYSNKCIFEVVNIKAKLKGKTDSSYYE